MNLMSMAVFSSASMTWGNQTAEASSEHLKINPVYDVGELFELGIQLSYLLLLLGLLGVGTFFVIRQVLVRRELDLSAKELQVLCFADLDYYLLLTYLMFNKEVKICCLSMFVISYK